MKVRPNLKRLLTIGLAAAAFLTLAGWVNSATVPTVNVDAKELLHQIQKLSSNNDQMEMAWWLPEEFWTEYALKGRDLTPDQLEQFLKIMRPYTMVAVMHGSIGPTGGVKYTSLDSIRASTLLIDAAKHQYAAYPDSVISSDAISFLQMMHPLLANMMGAMGENMHFLMFPATDSAGVPIAAARTKGNFTIRMGTSDYKWHLPLDALLGTKNCPKCRQECRGSWSFCAWCGAKLPDR
jgi:hypothetical protein